MPAVVLALLVLSSLSPLSSGSMFHIGETREVDLLHGSTTQASLVGPEETPVKLIFGHGLGSRDPAAKDRFGDATSNITFSATEAAGSPPGLRFSLGLLRRTSLTPDMTAADTAAGPPAPKASSAARK